MKQSRFINTMLLSLLLLISNITFGEKRKTTLDSLCGGEWHAIIQDAGPISKITLSFSKTQQTYSMEYELKSGREKHSDISNYYLSNTPDSTFDKKKIGKVKNGKYIIVRKNEIYEIITLTPICLKIRLLGGAVHEYEKKRERG